MPELRVVSAKPVSVSSTGKVKHRRRVANQLATLGTVADFVYPGGSKKLAKDATAQPFKKRKRKAKAKHRPRTKKANARKSKKNVARARKAARTRKRNAEAKLKAKAARKRKANRAKAKNRKPAKRKATKNRKPNAKKSASAKAAIQRYDQLARKLPSGSPQIAKAYVDMLRAEAADYDPRGRRRKNRKPAKRKAKQ